MVGGPCTQPARRPSEAAVRHAGIRINGPVLAGLGTDVPIGILSGRRAPPPLVATIDRCRDVDAPAGVIPISGRPSMPGMVPGPGRRRGDTSKAFREFSCRGVAEAEDLHGTVGRQSAHCRSGTKMWAGPSIRAAVTSSVVTGVEWVGEPRIVWPFPTQWIFDHIAYWLISIPMTPAYSSQS